MITYAALAAIINRARARAREELPLDSLRRKRGGIQLKFLNYGDIRFVCISCRDTTEQERERERERKAR